jgi:hypothetical protein
MLIKEFICNREQHNDTTTIGDLLYEGKHLCYTLEDTVRQAGEQVYGKTAIPEGTYKMGIRYSNRFKRQMVCLYTDDNDKTLLQVGDIKYVGVLVHGGNTAEDTLGCPLVAFNKVNENTIQGSAEHTIFSIVQEELKQGNTLTWTARNLFKP